MVAGLLLVGMRAICIISPSATVGSYIVDKKIHKISLTFLCKNIENTLFCLSPPPCGSCFGNIGYCCCSVVCMCVGLWFSFNLIVAFIGLFGLVVVEFVVVVVVSILCSV